MRLSTSIASICSAACYLQATAAATTSHSGHVFLLDRDITTSASHHETIDPTSARLIYAQRLGLSDFYQIEDGDDEVIRRINTFGSHRRHSLGVGESSQHPVFVLVDGVENPLELVPSSSHLSFFDIDPAPHPSQSNQLVSEVLSYHDQIIAPEVINSPVYKALEEIVDMRLADRLIPGAYRTIVHVRSLLDAQKEYGVRSPEYRRQTDALRRSFTRLAQLLDEEDIVVTVALMPLEQHCAKSSENLYNLNHMEPRAVKAPRQQPEAPLELTPNDTLPLPQNLAGISPLVATSALPLGPVPTCFSSKSACESGTNNCTGHGVCSLKYSVKEGDNPSNCFGCVCSIPDVQTNEDGSKKTTWYGGGACQKKDIVAPFWLLAGTSIFLVSIITFGVSMLYSMGNEELPSVIGAGVSGPRAK